MGLRKTVLVVASLNLIYFVVEFYYGHLYNSVALVGDSVDFLEDASINILIALAIGWSLKRRQQTSYFLALFLLIPGISFFWNAIHQFISPETPQGVGMSYVGLGALVTNLVCAFLIAKHRQEEGGLVMAAFYSARNDALANVAIITAGIFTLFYPSIWPDLAIGVLIFVINADAAKEVISAAKREEQDHRA